MKYQRCSATVEAIEWTGENWEEMASLLQEDFPNPPSRLGIVTTMGIYPVDAGDWIVRDPSFQGTIYALKPHVFKLLYAPVPPSSPEEPEAACGHCWHDTGMILTSYPGFRVEVCCWCGARKQIPLGVLVETGSHGPHKPSIIGVVQGAGVKEP